MKLKKIKKKIQQLEKRLREGPDKLARLKRKLQQGETAKALKAAARATANRKSARASAPSESTTGGKKSDGSNKTKRKLNLSPERRAQLAAAMKARWAAKRAAQIGNTTSADQNSGMPPAQPPENRAEGV
jgi:predicted  nucleic acid-binding Zn-ribbon protein